jgi:hypothetical protein
MTNTVTQLVLERLLLCLQKTNNTLNTLSQMNPGGINTDNAISADFTIHSLAATCFGRTIILK